MQESYLKNYPLVINIAKEIKNIFRKDFKIIFDRNKKLGNFEKLSIPYDINITKEELARDFIYSNNVFEHLKKPWVAAQNLTKLLKPHGIIITIVPFSQRYHEDPGDYFRYTHTGIFSLFEDFGSFELLKTGYDICGRRNNWQGGGFNNDIVPVDNFGAWRETWFTVSVMRKISD